MQYNSRKILNLQNPIDVTDFQITLQHAWLNNIMLILICFFIGNPDPFFLLLLSPSAFRFTSCIEHDISVSYKHAIYIFVATSMGVWDSSVKGGRGVDLPEILHIVFVLLALPRSSPLFCPNLGGQLPPCPLPRTPMTTSFWCSPKITIQ